MPLLTIITRTFGGRPLGLAANVASVERQARRDEIQHLIVVDSEGRGVGWAQENLRHVRDIRGDYVMLLDDDDLLVVDDLIQGLERQVADSPEVVIVQMDMGGGNIVPSGSHWQSQPEHSTIACSCYILRRDVWNEHVADFTPTYDGDFNFIDAVWKCGHPFVWWPRVVSRIGRVSHGQPEA